MKLESIRHEWTKQVEQWRSSGKSAKVWCQENNLVYTTFLGWTHRINAPTTSQASSFIELKDQSRPSSGITLECDDVRINLSSNFDPIVLHRCLQVLKGAKC